MGKSPQYEDISMFSHIRISTLRSDNSDKCAFQFFDLSVKKENLWSCLACLTKRKMHWPSKDMRVKIHKTVIFPVLLRIDVKLGLFTLREEHKLRLMDNRVLRKIFWPRRGQVPGDSGNLHNEKPRDFTLHKLFRSPNQEWDVRGMWHVWGIHVYSGCWWENLKERDIFQDLGVNRRIILISIYKIGCGEGGRGRALS